MNPEIENLHSILHRQHGREVVKGLRELEKTTKKIANWKNHRHFNVLCVHSNVTPPSIRLKSSVKGEAAQKILRKTEKKLLNVRIRQCNYTINKLEEGKSEIENKLFEQLSAWEKQEVSDFIAHAHNWTFDKTKTRHREKFERLKEKSEKQDTCNEEKYKNITNRWVVNLSDVRLEPEANSLLRKGLNFAVTPNRLPVDEFITATEVACRHLKPADADSLRSDVVKTLKSFRKPPPNISLKERKALESLKKNKDIMILGADKGRATVIMNTKDYKNKIEDLLKDENTYEALKKDPTNIYKSKLINILRDWRNNKRISDTLYHRLYPTSDLPPRFYGLPKIHKNNVPLRPIVSSIGNITQETSKYLTQVLSPLVGKNPHFIKNSADFVKKISNLEVPPGRKMISYDVSALFTSIPVDQALSVIEAKLKQDPQVKERSELAVEQLIDCLSA